MTEEFDGVRLGLPDSTVYALFSGKERPHDDELTFFEVRLVGPGLDAKTAVESISGDHGMRASSAIGATGCSSGRTPGSLIGFESWLARVTHGMERSGGDLSPMNSA